MYPRGLISTLFLIIFFITLQAARHRSHTRHSSARVQPVVIASTSQALAMRRTSGGVISADRPHEPDEPQRRFCDAVQPEVADEAANMIRVQVVFQKLAFFMFCHTERDIVSMSVRKTGSWEANTSIMALSVMESACEELDIPKENAIFLDIGANIGWYSLLFAAAGHSVISFEPMNSNKKLFSKSICSNSDFQQRLTYHTDILSDVPHKNCTMYSDEADMGDGMVSCDKDLHLSDYAQERRMDMTTLDILLAGLQHPVFMVKMGVEGREGHVLQGATKTILQAQVPYLMFEFNYAWVKRAGGHPDKLLNSLVEAGYQFSFKAFHGSTFDPLVYYADGAKQASADLANIFCTHKKMLRLGIARERGDTVRWFFG